MWKKCGAVGQATGGTVTGAGALYPGYKMCFAHFTSLISSFVPRIY